MPSDGENRSEGYNTTSTGAHGVTKPGWSAPKPEHVPRPTYWPVVMSVGITFILWGLITTLIITAIGLVLFGVALAGWIGEMRHEAGS